MKKKKLSRLIREVEAACQKKRKVEAKEPLDPRKVKKGAVITTTKKGALMSSKPFGSLPEGQYKVLKTLNPRKDNFVLLQGIDIEEGKFKGIDLKVDVRNVLYGDDISLS